MNFKNFKKMFNNTEANTIYTQIFDITLITSKYF